MKRDEIGASCVGEKMEEDGREITYTFLLSAYQYHSQLSPSGEEMRGDMDILSPIPRNPLENPKPTGGLAWRVSLKNSACSGHVAASSVACGVLL